MAAGFLFKCGNCGFEIEAWDDGNPYYFDENGKKVYAYHPSREWEKCIGNDSDYLCLSCGRKFKADPERKEVKCTRCRSKNAAETMELGGKRCPKCKKGEFQQDPDFFAIS